MSEADQAVGPPGTPCIHLVQALELGSRRQARDGDQGGLILKVVVAADDAGVDLAVVAAHQQRLDLIPGGC